MRKAGILSIVIAIVLMILATMGHVSDARTTAASVGEQESQWQCWHADPMRADPCARNINDLHMLSATDGWAVGDDGLILRWNGLQWASYVMVPGVHVTDVEMLSPNDGWAVGQRFPYGMPAAAVILRWDGSEWVEVDAPPGADGDRCLDRGRRLSLAMGRQPMDRDGRAVCRLLRLPGCGRAGSG